MPRPKPLPKAPKKKAESRGTKKVTLGRLTAEERKAFFLKIGSEGGTTTLANYGPDYYVRLAIRSHQVRRERRAAALAAQRLGPSA